MKKVVCVSSVCAVLFFAGLASAGLIAQFDGTNANLTPLGKIMTWYDQEATGGDNNAEGLMPNEGDPDTRPLLVDAVMPGGLTVKVADFDGVNDNLTIGGNSAFDGNNRTFVLVAKADSMASSLMFSGAYASGAGSNSGYMWDIWADGDSYRARGRTATGGSKAADSNYGSAGEWTIIIGTWQTNNNVRAYVYGLADETLTLYYRAAGIIDASPAGHLRSRIGSASLDDPAFFFDGQIAEVRYYDHNMDSTEVAALAEELQAKYVIPEPVSLLILAVGGLFLHPKKQ